MILSKINVDQAKMEVNFKVHEYSWEYYLKQYVNAFACILDISKEKKYRTNIISMPFLFLMRHSIELLLKYMIVSKNKDVPTTHSLTELAEALNEDSKEFICQMGILFCDTEGDCFRYLSDWNEFKDMKKTLEAFDSCNMFIDFYNRNKTDNCQSLESLPNSRKLSNELCFHPSENRTLGHYATSYDFAISYLLTQIQNGKISIQNTYLPLLFFYRHTLELKLKEELKTLGSSASDKHRRYILHEHSVSKLSNAFEQYVNVGIKQINDHDFKSQSEKYLSETKKFKDLIHNLDKNSQYFRYPLDKTEEKQLTISLKKDSIFNIHKFYQSTDSFLSFAIPYLNELGYIEIQE